MITNQQISGIFALTYILLHSCNGTGMPDEGNSPNPPALQEAGVHYAASPVSISTLLDEMVSYEEDTFIPQPWYTSSQTSSTDVRSISPNDPYWFGNQDNTRYVRMGNDNSDRRMEKVLFEQQGPGAVTRFWAAGVINDHTLRFYFDGESTPRMSIRGYDLSTLPIPLPEPMVLKHLYYSEKGGTSLHFPLPYAKSLKITIDVPSSVGVAYHIGYRTYEAGTAVNTFTVEDANSLAVKIKKTAAALNTPPAYTGGEQHQTSVHLRKNGTAELELPRGPKAIRHLTIRTFGFNNSRQQALMRNLMVKITFDGQECVRVPLGDFSGGGIGGRAVKNWYMTADGNGKCEWRFIMPYKNNAKIEIVNLGNIETDIVIDARVSDWVWHENTAYFHASFRQERDLEVGNDYDSNENEEFTCCSLSGKGVLKADVLSLYNYRDSWYGEGDEKIYVDNESFPSHFGTGIEDYYNTSFAPVTVFHTPLGGAVRADTESSYGYNTWLRSRNLDGITFNTSLKFNFELLGWNPGRALFSSTVFWYGTEESSASMTADENELIESLP